MNIAKPSVDREQNELIIGFKTNDRRCLEKIYSMYYRSVESYILKNSGSDSDAKDLFQEAMIAAWLNIKEDKFSPKTAESLGGYIFQIAKYKWLDKVKSKTFKSTMRIIREDGIDSQAEDLEEIGHQEQRIKTLKNLYAKLDEKCKNILDRFYYQKMSLDEIGSELSYDSGTVKTLKYRCMKKLRAVHLSQKKQ